MRSFIFLRYITLLFSISLLSLSMETQSLDSLWQVWQNEQIESTERLDALGDYIVLKYINPVYQLDTAIILAEQLEEEGRKLKKNCFEGRGLLLQGIANLQKHNYLEAAKLQERSISKLEGCDFDFPPESIYLNIGFCYASIGSHNEAIENCQKSLSISEQTDDKGQMSNCYINISRSYQQLGQYQDALHYMYQAKKLGYNLEHIYLNLGGIYLDTEQYDSALVNIELAIAGNEKIDDQLNLARSLFELGRLKASTGFEEEGLKDYETAVEMFKELKGTPEIAMTYIDMGNIEFSRKQFLKSIDKCETARVIAEEYNLQEEIRDACYCLYQSYLELGDKGLALSYLEGYHEQKDSLINEQQIRELTFLKLNNAFNVERKEFDARDQLNKQKIEAQNQLNNGLKIGIVLSLLSIGALAFLLLQIRNRNQTISEQHQQLTEKSTRLEELNQLKNRLFAIIGHDLRSPVGGLKSALDLLEDQTLSQKDFVGILPNIQRNTTAVHETLENLLFWAKSQIEGENIELTNVQLAKAIDETRSYLDALLKEKQLSFQHNISSAVMVKADENLLNLVLRNLIGNAIKFTPSKGKIQVNSTPKNGMIEIAIKDTGVGISPERIANLFHDGDTTWGTSGEKGTGIGLLLCKEVIEKNGGKIWVKSRVGEGSTFHFSLPVAG